MSKGKHWLFTSYEDNAPSFNNIKFQVHQRERCPTTDRLHWQGYVCFNKDTRFTTLKKDFPGLHFEGKKGTVAQAVAYCSKTETRVEETEPTFIGEIPKEQGQAGGESNKRKYDEAIALARENRLDEIEGGVYLRFFNPLRTIASENAKTPDALDGDFRNEWYFGETGTGTFLCLCLVLISRKVKESKTR